MSALLRKFFHQPDRPVVTRAEGIFLHTEDGRRLMDTTAGWCCQHVLGFSHPEVLDAMRSQMERFCHVDINMWRNPVLEELADLIVSQAPLGLDRVYFSGNSGSEATEAAMKLSFQLHWNQGNPAKRHIISRLQSYHGATLQSMAASELDILEFYQPVLPGNHPKIPPHYPARHQGPGETEDEYARRGAAELEAKIIELGPENVASFIGETMLGTLQGDVPPAKNYWRYIREVCDRYNVHLILDEVYCGLGRSGRIFCCDWDGVVPDFVCIGKALGAGYAPLSAVVTRSVVERDIAAGQGRIMHGHTHQGHSLAAAAALAVQRIVHRPETLAHINQVGDVIRERFGARLGNHPLCKEVRGRGSMSSLEWATDDNAAFAQTITDMVERDNHMIVNAKWHRLTMAPSFIITIEQATEAADAVIAAFLHAAEYRKPHAVQS